MQAVNSLSVLMGARARPPGSLPVGRAGTRFPQFMFFFSNKGLWGGGVY